ncbi:MAG: replicative DNA helicase [Verrucomicrobiota bacterium]|nr:replicative DNA helicase [Verrucomicrobiota bacterium]
MVHGRELPCNVDAEEGLLGAIILDGGKEVMTICMEAKLEPQVFYKPSHQIIFKIICEFYNAGSIFDEVLLIDRLKSRTVDTLPERKYDPEGQRSLLEFVGGDAAVSRLSNRIETLAFARHWLEIIKEKYMLRRLITTAGSVMDRCFTQQDKLDNFIEQVEQELFAISQDRVSDSAKSVKTAVEGAEQLIQKLLQSKGELSGVPSGFKDLDALTFGFQQGDMVVLAARPSMGKTAFALNLAESAIMPRGRENKTHRTLMYSLEMSAESLAMRMLCSRARVDSEKVRGGWINADEGRQIVQAARELKSSPFLIDDSSNLSILELRAKARRLAAKEPLGLIIIDYLQLISPIDSRVPREQQVAEISRGIKAMAKELKCPVIVLAQLNRESEKEKRSPRMSDLRESGSIEQDADLVMMLYSKKDRDKEQEVVSKGAEVRQLMIAKQRNGPVGEVTLTFIKDHSRFESYVEQKL